MNKTLTRILPALAHDNYREAAFYLVCLLFIGIDLAQTFMVQALEPGLTSARIAGMAGLVFFIAAPFLYRATKQLMLPSLMVLITAYFTITASAFYNGGAPAPTFLFFILMPLFAIILLGRMAGMISLVVSALTIVFCAYAAAQGLAPASPHSPDGQRLLFVTATLLSLLAITVFVLGYESVVGRALKALSQANEKLNAQAGELREKQDFLSTVMESVSDAIVAADAEGRLSVFNRMARRFHGGDARPFGSEEWAKEYNLYHSDGKTVLAKADVPLYRALQGEKVTDYEMVILTPDQQPRRLNANAAPLYNERGDMLGAVATMHDVTTERMQQDEIRRQNRELTQFSRIASSDLQTPLVRIIELSESLQQSLSAAESQSMRDDLRTITRNAEKMGVLIKDVLYMSRLPIGELSLQPVSLRECMEAAIDLSGLTEADCRFDFRFAQAPEVIADPHSLTNVFRNLILNASRVGGDAGKRHIEFTCELDGETLIAGVKDNGGGAMAEDTQRMFLPMEHLHTEMDQEGTGLALAISRKSIELMGGEIWVENDGDVCHIKFRLPMARGRTALAS